MSQGNQRMRPHMRGARPEIDGNSWGMGRTGEIDGGAWGQSKPIIFSPPVAGRFKTTGILRGDLQLTEQFGEFCVRTYAFSIENTTQQPAGVGGVNPSLSDVAVVAVIKYGLGGASLETEVNVKRGTMVTVPASFWDIGAYIEQVPDMSAAPGVLFPDITTGPKTVVVSCVASLGTHPGGATLPTRDQYFRAGAGGNPPRVRLPIPRGAARVTFQGDAAFNPALLIATYHGAQDAAVVVIPPALIASTTPSNVPAQATSIDLQYPVLSPDTLITVTWEIML